MFSASAGQPSTGPSPYQLIPRPGAPRTELPATAHQVDPVHLIFFCIKGCLEGPGEGSVLAGLPALVPTCCPVSPPV